MKTLSIIVFLSLIFAPGDPAPAGTIPPHQPARPNILLIVLDDAAPGLSSYGGPASTPHMDALAAAGRRYELAFTNSTGCNPSRVSFATGLLPVCVDSMLETNWRATLNGCTPGLGNQVKTIYQGFAEAGYSTLAVGKIMHSGTQQTPEFQQSIFYAPGDWMNQIANEPIHGLTEFYQHGSPFKDWGRVEDLRGPNGKTFTDQDLTDWRITTDAIERIAELPEPWFAAVGLVSPHFPRYVPGRLYDKYTGVPVPDVLLNDFDDMPHEGRQRSLQNTQNRLVVRDILSYQDRWRGFNAAYYASLEFADEQIGRLLAVVPDDTVVVVWSDHGYHLGQKLKIEKGALWRESYHIPLIITGPGVAPAVVSEPTNSTAIYPMLLSLAGLAPTDGIERHTLADGVIIFDGHAAIDDGLYAFIQYNALSGTKKQEFYNLTTDPLQWRNTAAGPVAQYRQRLAAYLNGN